MTFVNCRFVSSCTICYICTVIYICVVSVSFCVVNFTFGKNNVKDCKLRFYYRYLIYLCVDNYK